MKKFLMILMLIGCMVVAGAPAVGAETLALEAVAYSAEECSDGTTIPHTANGTDLRPGVIAVDPGVIAFGSILQVPGYGLAQAEDTGGAIQGMIIDLAMDSTDQANTWGRQPVEAKVLRRGWHDWDQAALEPLLSCAIPTVAQGKDPLLDMAATRAELAVMLARVLGIAPKMTAASFRDVPLTHWAAPTLAALREREIFRGSNDGSFHPDDPVTWSALVSLLERLDIKDVHCIYVNPQSLTRGEILIQLQALLK